MKKNKLFWMFGAAAALSFAACSNDDAVEAPDNGATNGDGSTAFLSVVINAAGETRATSGESDFEQGVNEQAVDKADFYFYTKEGAYVTTAQVWGGGVQQTGNVEFKGNTVLVLKDLNEEKAPAYLVTVLNAPANFVHGNTLAEMEANLALAANNADGYAYEKTVDGTTTKYFTMSTSSYIRTAPENNYEYFTTKVNPATFLKYTNGETPTQEQINTLTPVDIYVERLAVKVRVNYAATPTNQVTVGGKNYFKLTVSGGNVTNTQDGSVSIPVADVDLYLAIEGWGLNNLTQNSYMMKNFGYADADLWHNGTSGSAAALFRNYWAKAATIYGVLTPDPLKHFSLNDHMTGTDFNNAVGTSAYCFENTNTAEVLNTGENLGNLATSAMIYARIYQRNGDTMTPATMVNYNGIMFTEADYKAMILNALQTSVKYYDKTADGEGNTIYTQIAATDIQFNKVDGSNKGEVTVTLTTAAVAKDWYSYNGTDYTSVQATDINTAISAIIANIASHVYVYNGGLMYYNVPIEHYRNATPQNPLEEGDYGVVRNHIYDLSITGVTKLGKAIYNPEQVIIPDTPTDEDRYALGVRVNILSWKIVKQSVAL